MATSSCNVNCCGISWLGSCLILLLLCLFSSSLFLSLFSSFGFFGFNSWNDSVNTVVESFLFSWIIYRINSMLSRDWLFSRFLTAVSALYSNSFSFLVSMAVLTVAISFWNFSFLSASVTASTLLVAKSRLDCVWSFSRLFTAVPALFSISLVFWISFLPTSI